jgi:hypothetical protein
MFKRDIFVLLASTALFLGINPRVSAEIDQSSTTSSSNRGVESFTPIGQSFTPTLSQLDFVTLLVADGSSLSNGSTAAVRIHDTSIAGPILGTSQPIFLADCFSSSGVPGCGMTGGTAVATRFDFATSVALTPSHPYVLEPFIVSGDNYTVVTALTDAYPGGTAIYSGVADPTGDLWFIEGTLPVPEPSTAALLVMGCVNVWFAHRRRR